MSQFTHPNSSKHGLGIVLSSNTNSINDPFPSPSFINHPTDHSGGSGSGTGSAAGGGLVGVAEYAAEGGTGGGPHIVAMDQRSTQHQEAYYLFFVGSLGMALNLIMILIILLRRPLRRMTSAFLIHASFLNVIKAAYCIPFGLNLLSDADETKMNQPPDCVVQGSSFIVLITTSAFNMVAMVCTEAYTFQEVNVGGNSHGTTCCILFGVLCVYITSVILHLGPTLIGGAIVYNPDIGNCAFKLGSVSGYVANIMCIVIITFALVAVGHFLNKFYKEIQLNRPNRVSMLVRHSISLADDDERHKDSVSAVHTMTQDAIHRAKIFVITAVAFVLCWYPLFILIIMDMNFTVSPKVYQAFSFIAWSHPLVEPVILIFFDHSLNILSRFMFCDQDSYSAPQIAQLLSHQRRQQQRQQQQQQQQESEDLTLDLSTPAPALNSHNISMEIEDAFRNVTSAVEAESRANTLSPPTTLCRHCSSPTSPYILASSSPQPLTSQLRASTSDGDNPLTSSTNDLRGFQSMQPQTLEQTQEEMEMNATPLRQGNYDPVSLKDADGNGAHQGSIQC